MLYAEIQSLNRPLLELQQSYQNTIAFIQSLLHSVRHSNYADKNADTAIQRPTASPVRIPTPGLSTTRPTVRHPRYTSPTAAYLPAATSMLQPAIATLSHLSGLHTPQPTQFACPHQGYDAATDRTIAITTENTNYKEAGGL